MNKADQEPTIATNKQRKTAMKFGMLAVLMFGFAFAMVPLYKLVCDVAGLSTISTNSGRSLELEITQATATVAEDRIITVEFDATINGNVPWEFKPSIRSMQVKPGETANMSYFFKNNSDIEVVTQSIPGVTPWQATEHLKKIECFCFDTQTLQAGEAKDMGLQFVLDPALPKDITTVTLSYTIMDTNRSKSLKPDKSNLPTVGSANNDNQSVTHSKSSS
jgi:cytochrome c oxidase assembly protein subunit 11